jgi:predicted ATP-grasp superfamily ATP-dependent carboligase
MRVFLYEYTCATPVELPSLRIEGLAMLRAVVEDFASLPGMVIETLFDASLPDPGWPGVHIHRCADGGEPAAFRALAGSADFTLVIAPEFDELLESRSRWVLEAGGRLLGSMPDAIRLTADKLALAEYWRRRGVATPPCVPCSPESVLTFPAVCKPRFGAGSQATFCAKDANELRGCVAAARKEGWQGELIAQPFVPGIAASVALLLGAGGCVPLLPVTQDLSADGRFRYRGGRIPLEASLIPRATRLARQAVAGIDGLIGYFGVDLVLGEVPDGSADFAIEINPRLTTSYVGLRQLCRQNLAKLMLAAACGDQIAEPTWNEGSVQFRVEEPN